MPKRAIQLMPPAFQRSSNFFLLTYLPTYRATKRCSDARSRCRPSKSTLSLLDRIVKARRSLLPIKGPRSCVKNRPERKREADKLEVGLTTCCCGLLCESYVAIFLIFVILVGPAVCNEVMPVLKGFKNLERYITELISQIK